MKPKQLWSIGGVACLLVILGCCLASNVNPARRSEATIRDELLSATPIGSDEATVDHYAKRHFPQDNFFQWVDTETGKLLMLCYGCYNTWDCFPFSTCVQAAWYFDKNGKLTAISVSKWVDAP